MVIFLFNSREQIIELREKFWKQSQIEWLNELWSMAYQKLAGDLSVSKILCL